jgi:hypothetical protein
VLFLRDTTLMAQPFDASRLVLTGDAFPVAEQIQTQLIAGSVLSGIFSASENGVLVYQTGTAAATSRLAWFDRTGKALATVGEPAEYGDVASSPDGKHAAVTVNDPAQQTRDVWLVDLARNLPSRFTFDPADDLAPVWSPDGSRLVFARRQSGYRGLYQKALSGSGAEELVLSEDFPDLPQSWSPDGKLLLYTRNGPPSLGDLLSCRSRAIGSRFHFFKPHSTNHRAGFRRTVAGWRMCRMNPDDKKCT